MIAYRTRTLRRYWRKARTPKRLKVLQYEAYIGTKLSYALDAIPITASMFQKVDATYYGAPRQVMGMDTTYGQMQKGTDRTNSNKKLCELVEIELNKGRHRRSFTPMSTRIQH